jgi:mannose/fructose/N-acetylgalactosamine-specific phosphotransferase system component IID
MPEPLEEMDRRAWAGEHPPKKRGGSEIIKAVKWASIVGLFALAGLWSRVTPFEVVARFIVDAGAIVVMAQALLARHYAVATVAAALVFLYNPLAPVFYLSGEWQRAMLVASATPFLVSLVWRDMKIAPNA